VLFFSQLFYFVQEFQQLQMAALRIQLMVTRELQEEQLLAGVGPNGESMLLDVLDLLVSNPQSMCRIVASAAAAAIASSRTDPKFNPALCGSCYGAYMHSR
jgi:hypothetical protein